MNRRGSTLPGVPKNPSSTLVDIQSVCKYVLTIVCKIAKLVSKYSQQSSCFESTDQIYIYIYIIFKQVAEAQELEEKNAKQELMKAKRTNSFSANKKKSRHDIKRDEAADPLTPIREFEGEETNLVGPNGKASRTSNEYVKSYISLMRSQKKPEKEVRNRVDTLVCAEKLYSNYLLILMCAKY